MTFRAPIHRTEPQNIKGQYRRLSGFLRNTFFKENEPKSPEIYLGLKCFRTFFEKQTQAFSLGAPAVRLAFQSFIAIR